MRIRFLGSKNIISDAVRDFSMRIVEQALPPALAAQGSVSLTLRDVNGPRHGMDKECRVVLRFSGKQVVISDRDADLYTAIQRAGIRLRKTVHRLRDRAKSQRRQHE